MGRESKADLRAERDALAKQAESAAGELRVLAETIEAAIVTMPRWRSKPEFVALLQKQADRAHALSVALSIEAKGPDVATTHHYLRARHAVVAAVVGALAIVGKGALEEVGANGVDSAWPQLAPLVTKASGMTDEKPVTPASVPSRDAVPGPTPPSETPGNSSPKPFRWTSAKAIRAAREAAGLTKQDLARALDVAASTVSGWEVGSVPSRSKLSLLVSYFQPNSHKPMTPQTRLEYESAVEYLNALYEQ